MVGKSGKVGKFGEVGKVGKVGKVGEVRTVRKVRKVWRWTWRGRSGRRGRRSGRPCGGAKGCQRIVKVALALALADRPARRGARPVAIVVLNRPAAARWRRSNGAAGLRSGRVHNMDVALDRGGLGVAFEMRRVARRVAAAHWDARRRVHACAGRMGWGDGEDTRSRQWRVDCV